MSEPADKTSPQVSEALGEDEQENVQLAKGGEEHDDGEESDEYELADEGDSKEFGEEEEDDDEVEGNEEENQVGVGSIITVFGFPLMFPKNKNPNLTAMLLGDPNADEEEEEEDDDDEEDDYAEEASETAITNGKKRSREDLAEEASEEPEGKKAKA